MDSTRRQRWLREKNEAFWRATVFIVTRPFAAATTDVNYIIDNVFLFFRHDDAHGPTHDVIARDLTRSVDPTRLDNI